MINYEQQTNFSSNHGRIIEFNPPNPTEAPPSHLIDVYDMKSDEGSN